MSTISLRYLEDRLNREAPALSWQCRPVQDTHCLNGTNLPEEIEVIAAKEGSQVKGSPFYLSGQCLMRWGVDASASMICNELTPTISSSPRRNGMDWDRLAEF
ncbi:MAG: hypothetical protein ACO1QB_03235 [Verrucomicrobiales bacterium]